MWLARLPSFKVISASRASPPEPAVRPENVMRIWMIHIGQGDALLIHLPARYPSTANGRTELIDVLVDGGPSGRQLLVFLRALYPKVRDSSTSYLPIMTATTSRA